MLQIVPLPDSRKDQSRRRHRSRVVDLPPELFDAMTRRLKTCHCEPSSSSS